MTALARLGARMEAIDSLLCVGLDSGLERLPQRYHASATPQLDFNRALIEQTHAYAAAYKLNTAFYEARGAAGWNELARTVEHLRAEHPDVMTICDAKRGDIGATNEAYARAIFDELGFDAVTLQPYPGAAAMRPFLDRAERACIVLCRTSDPGAEELQELRCGDEALWEVVARHVRDTWDRQGNCMLVVGATHPDQLRRARQICPAMTFLVPGVGAQGGSVAEVIRAGTDSDGRGLVINASRSVAFAADPAAAARELRDDIRRGRDAALRLVS
ncbi:orotidine-5'-phosphate decarboxylase [soil metagenome]